MSGNTTAMKERVEKAIEAARRGDLQRLSSLGELGAAVVPHLSPHLSDADVDIRREVVALLASIDGLAAAKALTVALRDKDSELQSRAAAGIYRVDRPEKVFAEARNADALRKSVKGGNQSAAAILLLGYAPGAASVSLLRPLRAELPDQGTKLHEWSDVVPVSQVATVALSRLGDAEARKALLADVAGASPGTLVFLLEVARDIDDPSVLHALAGALDDEREIGGGVPSGAAPRRRLCDLAVDTLADRLDLKVGFTRNPAGRYGPRQIDEVRQLIRGSIPS